MRRRRSPTPGSHWRWGARCRRHHDHPLVRVPPRSASRRRAASDDAVGSSAARCRTRARRERRRCGSSRRPDVVGVVRRRHAFMLLTPLVVVAAAAVTRPWRRTPLRPPHAWPRSSPCVVAMLDEGESRSHRCSRSAPASSASSRSRSAAVVAIVGAVTAVVESERGAPTSHGRRRRLALDRRRRSLSAGVACRASDDDVDHAAGHDDDLLRRSAVERRDDLVVGERGRFEVVLARIGGDRDAAAHLAVDLDRHLDRVVDAGVRGRRSGTRRRRSSRRSSRNVRACVQSSSATWGTSGASITTIGSAISRGIASSFVTWLLSSISLAIAVLKRSASISVRTVSIVLWSSRRVSSSAGVSTTVHSPVSSSTMLRHSRWRNRYWPTTSRVAHGREASSGPIAIS